MRRRWHRILTAVLVIAIVGLAVRLVIVVTDDDEPDEVETTEASYSVADALALDRRDGVVVTGYVYDDGTSFPLRLCHGLVDEDPPTCQGPYLSLANLDEMRLDLRSEEGVRWTPEPVTLLGAVSLDRFTVTEILS